MKEPSKRHTDRRDNNDTGTALAVRPLPGEHDIATDRVDEVVVRLNRLYRDKGLETIRAVGELVLETFFGGDVDNFRTRGRAHVSFRKLAERKDLEMSYQFIWNSVAVLDQLRLLPATVANALPVSHHKLLLPIKDADLKLRLAEEAVGEGLGKRDFGERVKGVREATAPDIKLGRPPLPAFARAATAIRHAGKLAKAAKVTSDCFAHFEHEDARKLLRQIEDDIKAFEKLAERLRSKLA